MRIKEIMNEVVAVDSDVSIKEAAKLMASKDIGCLVAVKNQEILGIITERDVIKNISSLDKRISAVMPKKIITIEEVEELENAASLMKKNKIRRLPVVNGDGKLVGIITSTDLIIHSEDIEDDFFFD